jgi:general stress protein YciG
MRLQAFTTGNEPKTEAAEIVKSETKEASPPPKKRRGFAAMDRSAVRAIARKGGVAAHARGTAHEFTPEEARDAGRKGGTAPHRTRGKRHSADLAIGSGQAAPT